MADTLIIADVEWLVLLGGQQRPYAPEIAAAIERAFTANLSEAHITIRGTDYTIAFARDGGHKQLARADPTKTRPVVRRAAAAEDEALLPAAKRQKGDTTAAASSSTSRASALVDEDDTDEDEPVSVPNLPSQPAAAIAPIPATDQLALCWRADNSLVLLDAAALDPQQRWWSARLKVGVLLCRERPAGTAAEYWPYPGGSNQQKVAMTDRRPPSLLRSNIQKATRRMLVGTAVRSAHLHLRQEARTLLQKQVERLCVIALEDSSPCAGYAHLVWLAAALGATKAQCAGSHDYKLLRSDANLVLHATRTLASSSVTFPRPPWIGSGKWPFDEAGSFTSKLRSLSITSSANGAAAAAALILGRLAHKGKIPFDHSIRQSIALQAAEAVSSAAVLPPMLLPPPAEWLPSPPAECSQFGKEDELVVAADKHVMDMQPFMAATLPPPSTKAAEAVTWKISGWNVRAGDPEPSFPSGTWQSAMLANWPAIARDKWQR